MVTARSASVVLRGWIGLWLLVGACAGDDDDGGDGSRADAAAGGADAAAGDVDAAVVDAAVLDAAVFDAAVPDAAVLDASLDAAPTDASPDAAGPSSTRLVISSLRALGDAADALDLDEDGQGDDRLGAFWREIEGATGRSAQAQLDAAVAAGAALHLIAVPAPPGGALRPFIGQDLDGDPSDNFSGDEAFSIAPGTPLGGLLSATVGPTSVTAGPGDLPLRLPITGAVADVVAIEAVGARVVAIGLDGGARAGTLGGAILAEDVPSVILPALVIALNDVVEADCPDGPGSCAEGSPGQALLELADLDADGVIDPAELGELPFVETLLAADLDLFDGDGAFNPNTDGVPDALSFGLGFSAVGARFSLPGEPPTTP